MALSASALQFLLARSEGFLNRIQNLLMQQAKNVLSETGVGVTHQARANYARQVIAQPSLMAQIAAIYLAGSTNVRNTVTFEDEGPVTTVADADLASQINTDWNVLAGIDSGN